MGGVLSASRSNVHTRDRVSQLTSEVIDLSKDPYFMKNHLGTYECKLCLTLHNNEGNYLAHTQGKKHQANLARRAAKEAKEQGGPQIAPARPNVPLKKFIKIGRPGYKVTKQRDPATGQQSLLFQSEGRFWTHWIPETKQFFVQFHYKIDKGKIESKTGYASNMPAPMDS